MALQRSFIADLCRQFDSTTASEVAAKKQAVMIEAYVQSCDRIEGLMAIIVRDGSIAPPLVLRVTAKTTGYHNLVEFPSLIGSKIRAVGVLAKPIRAISPDPKSLIVVCDEINVISKETL